MNSWKRAIVILSITIIMGSLLGCTESSLEEVLEEKNVYCTVDELSGTIKEGSLGVYYKDFRVTITDNNLKTQSTFDISKSAAFRLSPTCTNLWNRVKYRNPRTGEEGYKYQLIANDTIELKEGTYELLDSEEVPVEVLETFLVGSSNTRGVRYTKCIKYIDNETGEIRTETVDNEEQFKYAQDNLGKKVFTVVRETLVISGGNFAYRYGDLRRNLTDGGETDNN